MTTLNIGDVSVGDWVRYRDREWEVCSIYQFTEEVGLFRKDSQICESIDDIHPIPITPEILEANGFEEHCGGIFRYEWMWQGESSGITLCSFDEELWFVDLFFKEGKDIMCNIPTFSIHQLQHILRLTGVDKEIVIPNK